VVLAAVRRCDSSTPRPPVQQLACGGLRRVTMNSRQNPFAWYGSLAAQQMVARLKITDGENPMITARRVTISLSALLSCAGMLTGICPDADAGEIGHFVPGVPSIRDFVVPEPGFYAVLYNYRYTTDRFNDADGDKLRSRTVGPLGGITVDVDVNVDVYALAPTFIWVSDCTVLGANYAAYISPSFADASVGASLNSQSGRGIDAKTSQFSAGDPFVQPLWLGWRQPNWDFALGYGFYVPVGRYDTETVTLPVVGEFKTTAADNIGLGFWTHQVQGAVSWYPWQDRRMAVSAALTYERHSEKKGFDVTPGDNMSLNWGISQYLPLNKDQTLLAEFGVTGYSSWQVTDDSGKDARQPDVRDEVHAAGVQLGLSHVPWNAALNLVYLNEFAAKDRFQGQSLAVNFALKL